LATLAAGISSLISASTGIDVISEVSRQRLRPQRSFLLAKICFVADTAAMRHGA